MATNRERPLISFVHGRHFEGSIFSEVQAELQSQGWESIAPTLDVEEGTKDLDMHAEQLAREESASGAREVIRAAWSWGANVSIRELGAVPIRKHIMIAGAFHKDSLAWAGTVVPDASHNVHYMAYESNPSKEAYREIARLCLFTDAVTDDETVAEWADKMRDHPRRKHEPPLKTAPSAPIDYIILKHDKSVLNQPAIAYGLSRKVSVQTHWMESDHVPMVSHPQELAKIIIKSAVAVEYQPASIS